MDDEVLKRGEQISLFQTPFSKQFKSLGWPSLCSQKVRLPQHGALNLSNSSIVRKPMNVIHEAILSCIWEDKEVPIYCNCFSFISRDWVSIFATATCELKWLRYLARLESVTPSAYKTIFVIVKLLMICC